MCIVIDTNCLNSVFNSKSANHDEFKPVLDWIMSGIGKVVIGGKRYREELSEKYLDLISELDKVGKVVKIVDSEVNRCEGIVTKHFEPTSKFDDQHIVALLLSSGCKLICSLDARATEYFKLKGLVSGKNSPKIYKCAKHQSLLCKLNYADCCLPRKIMSRKDLRVIGIS